MIKIKRVLLILIAVLFLGCKKSSVVVNNKITVAVAASCQFAFRDIAKSFKAAYGIDVTVITGSSGKLTTQIIHGAPYDIFVSANMEYPKVLENKNKTLGNVHLYGYGIPVFWTLDNNIDLERIDGYLASSKTRKIAIADPRNAPYGAMAVSYLKAFNLYDSVVPKLVFGESISQVNEYVLNKTVALGVSAKSIVMSNNLKEIGQFKDFSESYFIKQGLVVVKNDTPASLKNSFVDFVLSEKGKELLKSFGYAVL